MFLIYVFSACLIFGLVVSQLIDLLPWRPTLLLLADICLSYIMIEVGLEFIINKKKWKSYVKDYWVAATAAAFPWLFCFLYFYFFFQGNTWEETLFISRFAAPTSSGILFSMLAAAGLGTTWLFRKVQILAILDDIDTVLFLIPLQFLMKGSRFASSLVVVFVVVLIYLAWRYLHRLKLPSNRLWVFIYSIILSFLIHSLRSLEVETEVLLPAFVLGSLLYNPHDPRHVREHYHEHAYIEPEERKYRFFDRILKILFMILVGLLIPKITFETYALNDLILHVIAITVLANLGKCFPIFCYKNEATLNERTAVCVGMFSRGEMGAGILVLAIEYGASGFATTVAGLSLALNLLLTGLFITIVVRLVKKT